MEACVKEREEEREKEKARESELSRMHMELSAAQVAAVEAESLQRKEETRLVALLEGHRAELVCACDGGGGNDTALAQCMLYCLSGVVRCPDFQLVGILVRAAPPLCVDAADLRRTTEVRSRSYERRIVEPQQRVIN